MADTCFYKIHQGYFVTYSGIIPKTIPFLQVDTNNKYLQNRIVNSIDSVNFQPFDYVAFKVSRIDNKLSIVVHKWYNPSADDIGIMIIRSTDVNKIMPWFASLPYHTFTHWNHYTLSNKDYNPKNFDCNNSWNTLAHYIRGIMINNMINHADT